MPFNSFLNYPMSWKPERSRLKRPIYLSLANQLEQDIAGQGQVVIFINQPHIQSPGTRLAVVAVYAYTIGVLGCESAYDGIISIFR